MEWFLQAFGDDGDSEEEEEEEGGEEDGMEEEVPLLAREGDSSSSSEAEGAVPRPGGGGCSRFDASLPARHLYLGELEEEGQAAMEDEETTPTLPLLALPDRVLFPGETLPMYIYNPHAMQLLRDSGTRHRPVAIVTDLRQRTLQMTRPKQEEVSQVGTTAEVVAMRAEEDVLNPLETQSFNHQVLIVKFLGRQRFRLLELFRRADGQMDCRVAILPEVILPPLPLYLSPCPPCVHSGALASRIVARSAGNKTSPFNQQQNTTYHKLLQRPMLSGSLCQVPNWVFTLYNKDYLRQKIVREQMMMVSDPEGIAKGALPEDTVSLSYWLSRRLPVSDKEKLSLLSIHCPTLRLMHALLMLESLTDLCCNTCGKLITKKSHLFSMSVDGPVASYVNPGGYVHDTLTAKKVENIRVHGPASTEHSWFPGYSWTMLECRGCKRHKGWLFQATQRGLNPLKFYGLRRQCLENKPSGSGEGQRDYHERQMQPCAPS